MLELLAVDQDEAADDDEDERREDGVREHAPRGGAAGDDRAHRVADRDADADHRRDAAAASSGVAVGDERGRSGLDGVDADLDDEPDDGDGERPTAPSAGR